jgi:hypothetical protein
LRLKLAIVAFLALGLAVSQTSTERAYVWTLSGTSMQLREIMGMTWNAATRTWSVPTATAPKYVFGAGFITATGTGGDGGTITSVSIDTSYVLYRGAAPIAAGPCTLKGEGSGVMAFDPGYAYACVPNPAQPGTFRWGRAPMEFTW